MGPVARIGAAGIEFRRTSPKERKQKLAWRTWCQAIEVIWLWHLVGMERRHREPHHHGRSLAAFSEW